MANNISHCQCQSIALSPETLTELASIGFSDCLCVACLAEIENKVQTKLNSGA
jgi:hypothetical protein